MNILLYRGVTGSLPLSTWSGTYGYNVIDPSSSNFTISVRPACPPVVWREPFNDHARPGLFRDFEAIMAGKLPEADTGRIPDIAGRSFSGVQKEHPSSLALSAHQEGGQTLFSGKTLRLEGDVLSAADAGEPSASKPTNQPPKNSIEPLDPADDPKIEANDALVEEIRKANELIIKGEYEAALTAYGSILDQNELCKTSVVICINVGIIYLLGGDLEKAERALASAGRLRERGSQVRKELALTFCELAIAFNKIGDKGKAKKMLQEADRFGNEDREIIDKRADIFMEMGNYAGAAMALVVLTESGEGNVHSYLRLAQAYKKNALTRGARGKERADLRNALKAVQEAVRLKIKGPAAYYELADILMGLTETKGVGKETPRSFLEEFFSRELKEKGSTAKNIKSTDSLNRFLLEKALQAIDEAGRSNRAGSIREAELNELKARITAALSELQRSPSRKK